MTNRFDNHFAIANVQADGTLQVAYSTHDYRIFRFATRWQVETYLNDVQKNAPDIEWKILPYPEAVALGI